MGKWIGEFLTDSKYRVVANGEMSEIQSVLSGVPQGTVLAAILGKDFASLHSLRPCTGCVATHK